MATTMDELITRRFTSALNDPAYAGKTVYDLFEWSKRDVHLTDYKTGRVLCDMQGLSFPRPILKTRSTSSLQSIFAAPASR